MSKPRILYLDLESCGVNALKADLGFVVTFGYKWAHEKKAHSITISKKDLKKFNDKNVLIKASKIMCQADLLVGHYASVFDRRFLQGRLLIHGLPPIPPTRMRDTCFIARSVANYSSNRLKYLAKILSLKHLKMENGWPMSWFRVMQGDMKALKGLARYCRRDVVVLEELYERLLPFDNAHPRVYSNRTMCSVCGKGVQYRGTCWAYGNLYRRFQCLSCSHWGRENRKVK